MKTTVDMTALLDPDLDEVDYNDELEATQKRYEFIMEGIKAQQVSIFKPFTLPLLVADWLNHANDKYVIHTKNDAINLVSVDEQWLMVADGYRIHACKNQYELSPGLYYLLNDLLIPHPDKTKRYVDIWTVIEPVNEEIKTGGVQIDYSTRTNYDYGIFDAFKFMPSFSIYVQREYMEQALSFGGEYKILASATRRSIKIVWPDAFAIVMPCNPPLGDKFSK